jgi:hypothetical protein
LNFLNGVIEDHSLIADPAHLVVHIRLPWYRSLPVSCIERMEVVVDGQAISLGRAEFKVNDRWHPVAALPEQTDEIWFIQDAGQLRVPYPAGIVAGESKRLVFRLDVRIPYIVVGPDTALKQSVTNTATLVAKEGATA